MGEQFKRGAQIANKKLEGSTGTRDPGASDIDILMPKP